MVLVIVLAALLLPPTRSLLFAAGLSMHRAPLTRRSALGLLVRYPMLPMTGIVGIYRRALALWIRRVPLHRHVRATPIEVPT